MVIGYSVIFFYNILRITLKITLWSVIYWGGSEILHTCNYDLQKGYEYYGI